MADGATPEEIARAWSSQGRDAKSPLDYKIINGNNEQAQQNPNLEANKMSSVATEPGVSGSAFDSARALGQKAAERTDIQDKEGSRLTKAREAISALIKGPGKKSPQPT